MNEYLQNISQEKHTKIVNAAMEVFAKHPYKKASTAEIAKKAGIAKGLLFHYFENKRSLYFYLYDIGIEIISNEINVEGVLQTNDFFERLNNVTLAKFDSMRRHPFINSFFIKVYLEDDEEIKAELDERLAKLVNNKHILTDNIDVSMFRKTVDIEVLSNLIVTFSVEFIQSMLVMNPEVDMKLIVVEYQKYMKLLKENFYKEEFL